MWGLSDSLSVSAVTPQEGLHRRNNNSALIRLKGHTGVPCSHTISTPQNLITEAEYLWKAEKPDAELHRIASRWGVSRRTHSDVSCEVLNEYDLLRRIGRPTTKENR